MDVLDELLVVDELDVEEQKAGYALCSIYIALACAYIEHINTSGTA